MQKLNDNTIPNPFLVSNLTSQNEEDVAFQIVEAFSRRAKHVGIRAIAMSEIAKELRTSTKTIYKHFPSKSDLVHELVVRWESRIHKPISYYGSNLIDILRLWVKIWVENDAQYSTAFWLELKTDYPHLYKVYVDSLYERMGAMKERVTPFLKPGINRQFVWHSYFLLITNASKPKTFEKIGLTRENCVFAALEFWMHGALDLKALESHQVSSHH